MVRDARRRRAPCIWLSCARSTGNDPLRTALRPRALTSISPPLAGISVTTRQSFLSFSGVQCKGRRNQSMIRKKREPVFPRDKREAFARRSCSNQRDEIVIRSGRILIWEPSMKKPKIETEEQQPRKVVRADKAPTSGYSLVVDGHFKSCLLYTSDAADE